MFRKILEGGRCATGFSNHFRFNAKLGCMTTVRQGKVPLSLYDNKRFWVSYNKSYGYGHPETIKNGYRVGDILTYRGGYIRGTKHLIHNKLIHLRGDYEMPPPPPSLTPPNGPNVDGVGGEQELNILSSLIDLDDADFDVGYTSDTLSSLIEQQNVDLVNSGVVIQSDCYKDVNLYDVNDDDYNDCDSNPSKKMKI